MAAGFAKNDCVELVSLDIPTVTGFVLFPSGPKEHAPTQTSRNSRPCHRRLVFILVMDILLSLIPASAVFMGMFYVYSCPGIEVAANLVYIIGLSALFLIGSHIGYHFAKGILKEEIQIAAKIFLIITAILLLIEMIFFYSKSPTFEDSENYCDETFYHYTFYMNIVASGIVFPSLLLQYFWDRISIYAIALFQVLKIPRCILELNVF